MNEKEVFILNLMNSLVIADTKTISEIVSAKGIWEEKKAYANCYKYLNNLADLGKIEKHPGFWRLPNCKSNFAEHAQHLSKSLADILKTPYKSIIYREKTIEEVALRPDALVLLIKNDFARCFIYEEVNNENENYLAQKINTWKHWEGSLGCLSKLTGYVIPHFDIITSDELQDYLKTIQEAL